ncbi:MAG: nuclear transport factor 2 family protein [Gemmatimonadetes bacterium]|nr:nuclear transport factor 2 family protein [Gemmatimonadota bacterium]
MKRIGAIAGVVISLVAFPSRSAGAQQSAVADSIRRQADRFIAAIASRDIDQFVSLFTTDPDFIYVDAGNIYPDPPALRKAGAGFFGRIKTFNAKWDPAKVVVLGPDGGAFTGVMKVEAADTTGKAIWPLGKIWTLVYQRRGGKWQIVQAHEANVPPPRPAR